MIKAVKFSLFETERLHLMPMSQYYSDELCNLHSNANVMKYIGIPYSQEISLLKIKESEQHWLKHGFGLWVWILKSNNLLIGRGGLRYLNLDNGSSIVELAYMLHENYWGSGLASEVSKYSIEYAQKNLNLEKIFAVTTAENYKSISVMKKLGFRLLENNVHIKNKPYIIADFIL